MTKKYFDLLEELDSKIAYIVDELEQERDEQTDEEDEVPKVPLEELLDDMTLNTDMDQGAWGVKGQ